MADENKNKIEVLEKLILRSPIMPFEAKNSLISGLEGKPDEELERLTGVFMKSEEMFFSGLQKAGVDVDEYKARLQHYFQEKIKGLESTKHDAELASVDDLLNEM